MNVVTIIGRTTKEPEVRHIPDSQLAVASFTVAIDRPKKGEEKKTDFPRVKAFGKTAELCEKYMFKGQLVAVQGRIQTGSYEKDGVTVYTTDVIADRVQFLQWPDKQEKQDDIPDGFQVLENGEEVPF